MIAIYVEGPLDPTLEWVQDFADITADVDAFKGDAYPFAGPVTCP